MNECMGTPDVRAIVEKLLAEEELSDKTELAIQELLNVVEALSADKESLVDVRAQPRWIQHFLVVFVRAGLWLRTEANRCFDQLLDTGIRHPAWCHQRSSLHGRHVHLASQGRRVTEG